MAITYGMSVKEFWDDDPDLFWAYRFSYYERLKYENETFNQNAWLQGAYIYEAVQVAINNSFGKHKLAYSKYPYGTPQDEIDRREKEEAKKQQELLVAKLCARVTTVQAIMGKNESSTTEEGNTKGGENISE